MCSEKDIINMINQIMPRSEKQINRPYESDAEMIQYHGNRLLLNIDEFSQEDQFREHDPYTLGWNIAVGGISDILASGGKPLYYANSLTIGERWDETYIKSFSSGVADVLKKACVYFIGGDFGRSKVWRCTVTVIGELEEKALMRNKAQPGDAIFISGEIGTGNLEAFLKLYSESRLMGNLTKPIKNRFHLRMDEAILIRKYAAACIDTSDGVFNALNSIAEMSGTGYMVENLPYIKHGSLAARMFSLPEILLFLGECGEYELLFTVGSEDVPRFTLEAEEKGFMFYNIGNITEAGKRIIYDDGKSFDAGHINISARSYSDIKAYLNELIACVKE